MNLLMGILCSITVSLQLTSCSAFFKNRVIEIETLKKLLTDSNYDINLQPQNKNDPDGKSLPTTVEVNLFIRSISEVDDYEMEYTVQLTLRQEWNDSRLEFPKQLGPKYITLIPYYKIWTPDLFFPNEKESHLHKMTQPNTFIRIFPSGEILYSSRVSLTLACPMNLKMFPLDRQICSIELGSWSWTTNYLVFQWKDKDPVTVTKNLVLPRFSLEKLYTTSSVAKTSTGEYGILKVDLVLQRVFSYYLVQYYIPCVMLVIISWVSFWLDQSSMIARIVLVLITLLTMVNQTSFVNASLPPVSYVKAIDVWTGMCLVFTFGALLESAFVNYASHSDKCTDVNHKLQVKNSEEVPEIEICQCEALRQQSPNSCRRWLSRIAMHSKRIDILSRIIFPLAFLFFNVIYWFSYLIKLDLEQISDDSIHYSWTN